MSVIHMLQNCSKHFNIFHSSNINNAFVSILNIYIVARFNQTFRFFNLGLVWQESVYTGATVFMSITEQKNVSYPMNFITYLLQIPKGFCVAGFGCRHFLLQILHFGLLFLQYLVELGFHFKV